MCCLLVALAVSLACSTLSLLHRSVMLGEVGLLHRIADAFAMHLIHMMQSLRAMGGCFFNHFAFDPAFGERFVAQTFLGMEHVMQRMGALDFLRELVGVDSMVRVERGRHDVCVWVGWRAEVAAVCVCV